MNAEQKKKYIHVYGFIAMLLIIDFHKISYLTLEWRINEIKILNRNQYCGNVKWSEQKRRKRKEYFVNTKLCCLLLDMYTFHHIDRISLSIRAFSRNTQFLAEWADISILNLNSICCFWTFFNLFKETDA